ncbi:hypothetical protein FXW78_36225 [Rhodococcus opacus]|nr:hypothetical protein [Rhodococcus opacus]
MRRGPEGEMPGWAPLPVQYATTPWCSGSFWAVRMIRRAWLAAQVEYWRAELAGLPECIELPTDRRTSAEPSYRGGTVEFVIDPELVSGVDELARGSGATPSMVLQSVLAVLLRRLGAGRTLRSAGRLRAVPTKRCPSWWGSSSIRGCYGWSCRGTRDSIRCSTGAGKALAAYENQDAPFERLVELLNRPLDGVSSVVPGVVRPAEQRFPQVEFPGLEWTTFRRRPGGLVSICLHPRRGWSPGSGRGRRVRE